ncbi:MAG: hypothetical protein ACTTH7_02550 [Treponema sp.]
MTETELIKCYKNSLHKKVMVTCTNGTVFDGICSGFTRAIDNEPEIASIMLDSISKTEKIFYDIFANEIERIEVLD